MSDILDIMKTLFINLDSAHIDDININGKGYVCLKSAPVQKTAVFYISYNDKLKKVDFIPPKNFIARIATINNQDVYISNQLSFTDGQWLNLPMIALIK